VFTCRSANRKIVLSNTDYDILEANTVRKVFVMSKPSDKEKDDRRLKKCFFIAPIGEEGSPERIRSDDLLNYVIRPIVKEFGYEALRADEISEPGLITSQIIKRLVEDELVVADLAGHNANVFYELAIRHAVKKPVIQLYKKGERIPFDVSGMRSVELDDKRMKSVEDCKAALRKHIAAIEKSGEAGANPISAAFNLAALQESSVPADRRDAQMISMLEDIKQTLRGASSKGATPVWPMERAEDPDKLHLMTRVLEYALVHHFVISLSQAARDLRISRPVLLDLVSDINARDNFPKITIND
jgi:hypothetical protein